MAKKSRATTIRLPTAYDDFFARFDSKSAAVRAAIDFYLQAGERLDRLEASVYRLQHLVETLLNQMERGAAFVSLSNQSNQTPKTDDVAQFLASGLEDF